ncbi:MAG: aminopeptidase P family protein [Cetobacterium sp.]|uniref:aminopeptidase P family protein n=1 Tax=Cetobacterium sp. TaxID=2071632 RepID=UPI003F2ED372
MLKENQGLLVIKKENKFYLSNFTGSGGYLLVTSKKKYILIEGKYEKQAQEQCKEFSIVVLRDKNFLECLREICKKNDIEELIFEEDTVVYSLYKELEKLPFKLVESGNLLENQRVIKKYNEIEILKKSCDIAQKAIERALDEFTIDMNEKDLADSIERNAKKLGAEKIDFIIVASGKRGALPHGRPTDKKIELGELVTIDFGSIYKGYHSDITRTYAVGKVSLKLKEIYDIVKEAQQLGVSMIKPEMDTKEIDRVVREYIKNAGYGEYFVHGLGHGVGIEGHEKPFLNEYENNILKAGMVLTIEPGIYIPELGGVRIEDTVLVTNNGYELLTTIPKEFKEIGLC